LAEAQKAFVRCEGGFVVAVEAAAMVDPAVGAFDDPAARMDVSGPKPGRGFIVVPEATPIVDIYHARQHLHDLAANLAPALGDTGPSWLTARLADLDAGDIETLVAETDRLSPQLPDHTARHTTKALAYFKTNAHRMRYAYFREHGMFIGSGTVEAGCKAVIGQRLKLSGMRWNIPGATGILTLRCQQASNRFEHIWTHPHNQTATA
jgi:hypothetical protein